MAVMADGMRALLHIVTKRVAAVEVRSIAINLTFRVQPVCHGDQQSKSGCGLFLMMRSDLIVAIAGRPTMAMFVWFVRPNDEPSSQDCKRSIQRGATLEAPGATDQKRSSIDWGHVKRMWIDGVGPQSGEHPLASDHARSQKTSNLATWPGDFREVTTQCRPKEGDNTMNVGQNEVTTQCWPEGDDTMLAKRR